MSLIFSQLGARQQESDIARLMTMALERPDLLSLAAGFTDNDSLPLKEVSEIAVQLGKSGDKTVLQYGPNHGRSDLRTKLTQRLSEQDDLPPKSGYDLRKAFISNGSQQALYLAVQTLCDAGDVVLVEQPTYFVFLEMLRGLGINAVSLPMQENGEVDAAKLDRMLEVYETAGTLDRVKAVYLVSYYANPSGHSVSTQAKSEVLEILGKRGGRIALFEDAAYRELYYAEPHEARSALRLGLDADLDVPIFYTTTLTKPFASGLKVGYGYCTHSEWLGHMLAIKGQQDFGTAHYAQAIFNKVFESGLFDRHLDRIRSFYYEKMDTLDGALRGGLSDLPWSWERPSGGLYLWVTAPESVETGFDSRFYAHCLKQGVMYVPGDLCHADRKVKNRIRLSFGVLAGEALKEAAARFCRAARAVSA